MDPRQRTRQRVSPGPGGRAAQAAGSASDRQVDLDRRLFGREATQETPAPDAIHRLQVIVHRANNLPQFVADWRAPQCVVTLNEARRCSPKGSAFGPNPVFDWQTELRHTGNEKYMVFEVRQDSYVYGSAFMALDMVRRAGEVRKALPLMVNGRFSGIDGERGEPMELLVTVRCILNDAVAGQLAGGMPAEEQASRTMQLRQMLRHDIVDRAKHLCSQVRITVKSVVVNLKDNDTDVEARRLNPYVKVSLGGPHTAQTPVSFVPHHTEAEEFVYEKEVGCISCGGLLRGKADRYEPAPMPAPPGSFALPAYRKLVDGDLRIVYRDVRFVFWWVGQESLALNVVDDHVLWPDEDLVAATVDFDDLYREAYPEDGELPSYAHTGVLREPLKAIELPIKTNDESQVVGHIEFEVEFFQDPVACPSAFESLWRRHNLLNLSNANAHLGALAAIDPVISGESLEGMMQALRAEVRNALADTIVAALVVGLRRVVKHEEDACVLQERTGGAVEQMANLLQLPRPALERLDEVARDAASPLSLKRSAEVYRRQCADIGLNPVQPIVGFVFELERSGAGCGASLRCAVEEACVAIGGNDFNGRRVFGLTERYVTISLPHPPVQEFPRIHPHCMNAMMIYSNARDFEPGEVVIDAGEISEQSRKGKAALASFFPSIDPSQLCAPTHPGDKARLVKESKGHLIGGSAAMGLVAGIAGGMSVVSTSKLIKALDDDYFCNPKYQTGLGMNKVICKIMKDTPADEMLANWLATRKGFVLFFWLYAALFTWGTYDRLTERFSRVRELAIEPTEAMRSQHAVLCFSGFLNTRADIFLPWEVHSAHPWTYGQVYCVRFETELLLRMGHAFNQLLAKVATQSAKAIQLGLSLTNPVSLINNVIYAVVEEFNDIFDLVTKRAAQAGKYLANMLLETALNEPWSQTVPLGEGSQAVRRREHAASGQSEDEDEDVEPAGDVVRKPRPVSLCGYSFGGCIVVACLQELHRISSSVDARAAIAADLVCDVVIIGAPVGCTTEEWTDLRRLVSGRFINGFLRSDKDLMGRQIRAGFKLFAGCNSLHDVPGIRNMPMDDYVTCHAHYAQQMPTILANVFND